jgi:TatD DNase family protein
MKSTIVKTINLEKLLIETDAPYLSPEPLRGKINIPGNVAYVFEEVVKHRTEHREQVEKKILGNSEKIFHVKTNEQTKD